MSMPGYKPIDVTPMVEPLLKTSSSSSVLGYFPLDGADELRAVDLAAHLVDLEFANTCLDQLAVSFLRPEPLQEALWRSAIIHTSKCYGRAGRFRLLPEAVFKERPDDEQAAFEYFKKLRNKHVAHDERTYNVGRLCAVLRDEPEGPKFEGLLLSLGSRATRNDEDIKQLRAVIQASITWAKAELDRVLTSVEEDVKKRPIESILSAGPAKFDFAQLKPTDPRAST